MKTLVTLGGILVAICLAIGVASAANLEAGFMGIQWGSPAARQEGLTWLYERENVNYYTQPDIVHTIHEIPVPDVVYGFYEDQFFAVFVNLESEDVFGEIRRYLTSQYGNPVKSLLMQTSETVYKWKQGQVKIKLKTNERTYRMKLGLYFLPLSQKVNEERMEKYHDNSRRLFPIKKGEKPKQLPLLRF